MQEGIAATAKFEDRRKHARADMHFPIQFSTLNDQEALHAMGKMDKQNRQADQAAFKTENISLGGVGIQGQVESLGRRLKTGDMLEMEITLPGSTVRCLGTVVWYKQTQAGTFTAGVAFMGLDQAALGQVETTVVNAIRGLAS
jgi:hypothetical protein